ncbi:ATP-binding protein, partial [Microbispora triticiradicis]|uniref:ATP-binding protein n=1 Tax=Microbispora triticiradicis TaxID=2200763 RepID=UPI001AD65997
PGIGKTSLLEALDAWCADAGHVVVWGRCHDTQGTPALWPWVQVLGALEQYCPPPDRSALAGVLDDEVPAGPGGAALLRRNQAIAQWLVTAARTRPVVIVLDDLQWADPASLELLRDVVVLVGGMAERVPLSVVGAFRAPLPVDSGVSVDELLVRLAGYDLVRICLQGLGVEAVGRIAEEMGVRVDDEVVARLTDRTGGNPFFVRESVRLLAQERPLETVPDAVAELVRQRLAALGPQAVEVLRIAAVVGRDFDPGLVCQVGGAPLHPLDQATRAGLLTLCGGRLVFTHDVVRECLLRDIPPLRKAVLHRDVMTALSSRPGADVAVIAHHAVKAGPRAYEEAVRWAGAAAEQATLRLAYEEAASWWDRAVKAHDAAAGDPGTQVELLLRQVHALLEAGDPMAARQVRADAVRAADRVPERPDLAVQALTALDAPTLWTTRDPRETIELRLVHRFQTTLDCLPESDSPERARLLAGLAQELDDGSGDERCDALSAQAVDMARRLGDPHLLMRMLNARHLALPQPPHLAESTRIADELHELALGVQAPGFELLARMMHTHNRLESFDLAGADRAAARCAALLECLPLPWPRCQHTLWQAGRLALDGRFDEARAAYDEAERQADRLGWENAAQVVAAGRLTLAYCEGRMGEAGPLIGEITCVNPSLAHAARVLHLSALGRRMEARVVAADGWRAPVRDWSWLSTTCLQAAAQAAVGDVSACHGSHSVLLPYRGRIVTGLGTAAAGPVDWYLALLASATGDQAGAVAHLSALEQLAERAGLTWWRDRARTARRAFRQPPRISHSIGRFCKSHSAA